ncbi:MAG: cysteine--tRNA ligase [Desulfobacterales bacterium]|nr:cysteine--tRNA ligase [Desulfobacterales bacterium]
MQENLTTTSSILDQIGNTPLVEIKRLNPNPNVKILAKLEYFNPGGSVKDRAALAMIAAGEKSGELTHAKTVIEATSGNTGIGLALVCSVKGYRLLLAMSELVSVERQKILKGRGAEILLTPGHLGTDGAIEEVYSRALANPDKYFMADQFNNPANWQAHYTGTAVEIWEQTGGKLDVLVATLGTAGTLMGLSRRFKAYNPEINIVGVEPYLGHRIQGLKNLKEAYRPEIFEKSRLDEKINIDDEEAFEMTRRLARIEGLFVGMSSGAAMAIACKKAREMQAGTIVVIMPDNGERYLSTPLFDVHEKVGLKVFNTVTRQKESLDTLEPGKISIYSCGPTAHARMHLGECRRYIFSDLLCRYLQYRGYAVNHVVNITDLDDKTIAGADAAGIPHAEFTQKNIDAFLSDLDLLGIQSAKHYPRTSENIDEMVSLAEKLVEKGFAYEKLRSLYFDISRFSRYGKLSGIDLDKIRLGATVDLDDYEKDNPRDFTLLRRSTLSELKKGIFKKTRWGNIRPAWHIQCAAMSMKYLGETFDLHTSGRELIFPHHENEIAIAGAVTGKPLARYWMHCDTVSVDGKAVDTKGAGLTLPDLMQQGHTGRQVRCWLLTTHYRKPVTFSAEKLLQTQKALGRLDKTIQGLLQATEDVEAYPDLDQLLYDIKNGFSGAMDDDLNISRAMASVFKYVKKINILLQQRRLSDQCADQILQVFRQIDSVLGLFDFSNAAAGEQVRQLIRERDRARGAQDWEKADRLRVQLEELGVVVMDFKA